MLLFRISAIKGIISDLEKFTQSADVPMDKKEQMTLGALGAINEMSSMEKEYGNEKAYTKTRVQKQRRKTGRSKS